MGFGRSKHLSLNKFFNSNTPSMRKGRDREKKMGKNPSLAAKGALAHRLQRRTACQWAPKWPTGSGKVSTPRFWGAPVNFR